MPVNNGLAMDRNNHRERKQSVPILSTSSGPSVGSAGADQDIDNVQCLIECLYIERKHTEHHHHHHNHLPHDPHHHQQSHHQCSSSHKSQCRISQNNPFKRKSIKRQRRKLSICYDLSQCKDILEKLNSPSSDASIGHAEDGENCERVTMLKITDKMAKSWNEHGYRVAAAAGAGAGAGAAAASSRSITTENGNNEEENFDHSQLQSSSAGQQQSTTCARQAMYDYCDSSVTELAAYLDETLFIPRKMSFMAEMMYT